MIFFRKGGGNSNIFLFSPRIPGEDEPILTNIFQMGWFNHQPVFVLQDLRVVFFLVGKLVGEIHNTPSPMECFGVLVVQVHPWKPTWNLKIPSCKRKKTPTNHQFCGSSRQFSGVYTFWYAFVLCVLFFVIFVIRKKMGKWFPISRACCSNGLKPPTSSANARKERHESVFGNCNYHRIHMFGIFSYIYHKGNQV